MKVNKVQQGGPNPFCSKGNAWTISYNEKSAPEDTWELSSS